MRDNCTTNRNKYDTTTSMIKEFGVDYISNENLLATVLGIDCMSQSFEEIKAIFDGSHSLRKVSNKTFQELTSINGIGEKKAASILAAFELGKRLMKEKSEEKTDLGSSSAIYEYIKPYVIGNEYEEAYLLISNQNFKLLKCVQISKGSLTETTIDVRRIIKETVAVNGTIISLVHNHPSNSPTPSKNDDKITFQIQKACDIMRIYFQDHIIVASDGGSYYSYHDRGRL